MTLETKSFQFLVGKLVVTRIIGHHGWEDKIDKGIPTQRGNNFTRFSEYGTLLNFPAYIIGSHQYQLPSRSYMTVSRIAID